MLKRKRRNLDEIIADLETQLSKLKEKAKERGKFSPEYIRNERDRLGLSASDYGRLVGVSHLTIYNWEHGRSSPHQKQLEQWLEIRDVSAEDAYKALGIHSDNGSFSPKAVYEERQRLELSAKDFGELLSVSGLTIYNWEKGKAKPQRKQLAAWQALKGIGKRRAWKQLGY